MLVTNPRFDATLNPTDSVLSRYLQEVAAFCPYLRPSISAGLCVIRPENICGETLHECQAEIFYLSLQETEIFRSSRHDPNTRLKNGLLCHNLLLTVPANFDDQGEKLFGWPHYLLKLLYTNQAILFGKFWKGEQDLSLSGKQLPIPPVHLLSIRSRISEVDKRFFEKSPELLEAHIEGDDTGENVHERFGLSGENCKDINKLRNANYYDTILEYGRKTL